MSAPRRLVPMSQVKELFAFLREQGIDVARCGVDIGSDYVKVLPPANSNAGASLADYLNGPSSSPKKAGERR